MTIVIEPAHETRVDLEGDAEIVEPGSNGVEETARLVVQLVTVNRCAVDIGYRGNLSRRMKRANRIGARFAVIIGDEELAAAAATVRDLDSGEQSAVALDRLADFLAPYF